MANYSSLKSAVTSAIKTNGNREITGAVLQSTLLAIINSLGNGFIYRGIVTPQSNPGTSDQNVFYVGGPGTYSNFGTPSKTVNEGYLGFFKYNGSWSFEMVQVGDANAVKYIEQTLTTLQKQQARTNIGAGTYSKPDTGIPSSDMSGEVQTSLGKANSAYQKPNTGIPSSDMASAVQNSLGKADTAYQKPNTGIPSSDMASAVQTSLGKANSAYQKPGTGIPSSDMSSSVQNSLGKADTAYQKPSSGIPANDLADGVIPTISTDISADAESNVKTASPKAVKTYVDAHSGDGAVKYISPQTLTNTQKQQARNNIDAASIAELDQLESEVRGLSGRYYGIFDSIENLPEGDVVGYAFIGTEAPFTIYQFDGTSWADSGAKAQAIYGPPGRDGIGLQTITSLMDGTVVLSLTNGDTVTIDLNHQHPQYPKYVMLEDESDMPANPDSTTLYMWPLVQS